MSIKLISLPAEILESIIVTLNDAPLSILALSKTCTTFFILLYKAPDHHVWRTLFLSRYDDPRQTDHLNLHPFNKSLWRDEYLARAVAEERIPHGTDSDKWLGIPQNIFTSAVESLNRLCSTARILQLQLPEVATQSDGSTTGLFQAYKKTSDVVQCVPEDSALSSNIERLRALANNGHFHPLTQWLSPPVRKLVEDQALVACKLIASLGFRHTIGGGALPDLFDEPSYKTALKAAARRVYNMDYPKEDRMYGPFLKHRREKFTPDWLHLASVRLLCEQGILEHSNDVLKQLTELDRLRPGSWATGLASSSQVASTSETSQNKDWAGVEGVWRQLVIWMGYEALVEFQHDKNNYSLVEHRSTHIVVPLYLHVVSYEDDPHGSPLFPIIHFEGQIGGEGWHVDPEPQHGLDIHPVEGKVCMLSDGSVRWSLVSYTDIAKKEKEWRSEGVQIGGIGSMAGVLGTWTGADYDPDDPIGGWWRWKVA